MLIKKRGLWVFALLFILLSVSLAVAIDCVPGKISPEDAVKQLNSAVDKVSEETGFDRDIVEEAARQDTITKANTAITKLPTDAELQSKEYVQSKNGDLKSIDLSVALKDTAFTKILTDASGEKPIYMDHLPTDTELFDLRDQYPDTNPIIIVSETRNTKDGIGIVHGIEGYRLNSRFTPGDVLFQSTRVVTPPTSESPEGDIYLAQIVIRDSELKGAKLGNAMFNSFMNLYTDVISSKSGDQTDVAVSSHILNLITLNNMARIDPNAAISVDPESVSGGAKYYKILFEGDDAGYNAFKNSELPPKVFIDKVNSYTADYLKSLGLTEAKSAFQNGVKGFQYDGQFYDAKTWAEVKKPELINQNAKFFDLNDIAEFTRTTFPGSGGYTLGSRAGFGARQAPVKINLDVVSTYRTTDRKFSGAFEAENKPAAVKTIQQLTSDPVSVVSNILYKVADLFSGLYPQKQVSMNEQGNKVVEQKTLGGSDASIQTAIPVPAKGTMALEPNAQVPFSSPVIESSVAKLPLSNNPDILEPEITPPLKSFGQTGIISG